MTIQDNIRRANEALATVKAHCMAFNVVVKKDYLLVWYPLGYRVDGLRVSMANGLAWACNKAIELMEIHWAGGL
jgi:hypothetical protein